MYSDRLTFVQLGQHGEHSITLQHVLRLEELAETRGGHVVEKDGVPVFNRTLVVFDDGTSIVVPHSKREVLERFMKASQHHDPA